MIRSKKRRFEKMTPKQLQALKTAFDKDSNYMTFSEKDGYNVVYTRYYMYATKGSLDALKEVFGGDDVDVSSLDRRASEWLSLKDFESVGKLVDLNADKYKAIVETSSGYGVCSQKTLKEVTKFFTTSSKSLEVFVQWNVDGDGVLAMTSPTKDEIAIALIGDVRLATEKDFKSLAKELENRITEEMDARLEDFTVYQDNPSKAFAIAGVHFSSNALDLSEKYREGYRSQEITVQCRPKGSVNHPNLEVFAYVPDTSIDPRLVAKFLIKDSFSWKTSSGWPDYNMIYWSLRELKKIADWKYTMDFSHLETKIAKISMVSLDFSDSFDEALPVIVDEITKMCDDYSRWVDEVRSEIVKQYSSDPDVRRFSDSPDKTHPEVPDVQYPKRLSDFVKSPYANESLKRRVETKTRKVCSIPCILKSNRRRHFEDATDELSGAVDVIEGKDKFDARAFKFEVRSGNSNGMIKNGKFVGKLSANLTMRYEGAECSVSVTDTKAEMTVDEMPDVTTSLYAVTVQLPTNRRDMTIEREGDGYVIHIAADCNVDCPETMKSLSALCYCHFTFHVTNKRTVGKMSAWILEGVDDSVKKKRGGGRRRASSLAGMLDLDMFADGTTYDDLEYALSSGDYSSLF